MDTFNSHEVTAQCWALLRRFVGQEQDLWWKLSSPPSPMSLDFSQYRWGCPWAEQMPIFIHSLLYRVVDCHVQLDKRQHGKIWEQDLLYPEWGCCYMAKPHKSCFQSWNGCFMALISLVRNTIVQNPSADTLQCGANTLPSSLQQAAAPREEVDLFCLSQHTNQEVWIFLSFSQPF